MPKKKTRSADPYAAREARRYESPIASREHILEVLNERGSPIRRLELAGLLEINDEQGHEALKRRLNAMERDGQLVRNRRGGFCVVNNKDLIPGRVLGHPDGFGFLRPDEGGDDLFLSPREMRSLMHDDRVVARVSGIDRRGRREGSVVEVIERNTRQIVGRLYSEKGVVFVTPEDKRVNHDILIAPGEAGDAQKDQIVLVEITGQPDRRTQPLGRVIEVLGDHMAPGMEIDVAIRMHSLPVEWPESVEEEALRYGASIPDEARKGRKDIRKLPLVTIDGADSRDFDDAVYCEAKPKGWRLVVAIADVAAYVEPGSALDEEARSRGNSVYFPDRVIPMLPEALSNGLCSLNPDEDRLCMVCDMNINHEGKVTRSRFYDGVMRSHARLTYDQVADVLVKGGKPDSEAMKKVLPHLKPLYDMFKVLLAAREQRGAIDFETTETRIVFGDQRKIDSIVPVERNDAHRIIEECMVAANVCAGRYLQRHKMPALYRIHDGPAAEKLVDLRTFLGEAGLQMAGKEKPEPRHYAELLKKVGERPDKHLIQTVMLRSLSQAVYSPDNIGHFGLAHDTYAHFTSPIRRYPDLVVHRAIRHCINKGTPEEFDYSHGQLMGTGEHCSATERRADEATRDAIDWLKCEYMMDRVGGEFDGYVVSVTGFGLFVELENIYVTGLVHITSLPHDYYHFEPATHRLQGERTGRVFRLADKVRVQVVRVDLDDRKIDMLLAGEEDAAGKKPEKGGRTDKSPKGGSAKKRGKRRGKKRGKESGKASGKASGKESGKAQEGGRKKSTARKGPKGGRSKRRR